MALGDNKSTRCCLIFLDATMAVLAHGSFVLPVAAAARFFMQEVCLRAGTVTSSRTGASASQLTSGH
jgi:hypothetical protein